MTIRKDDSEQSKWKVIVAKGFFFLVLGVLIVVGVLWREKLEKASWDSSQFIRDTALLQEVVVLVKEGLIPSSLPKRTKIVQDLLKQGNRALSRMDQNRLFLSNDGANLLKALKNDFSGLRREYTLSPQSARISFYLVHFDSDLADLWRKTFDFQQAIKTQMMLADLFEGGILLLGMLAVGNALIQSRRLSREFSLLSEYYRARSEMTAVVRTVGARDKIFGELCRVVVAHTAAPLAMVLDANEKNVAAAEGAMISVDEKRIWTLAPDLLIDQGIVDRLVRMGKGLTDFTEDELAFPEKDLFLRHHLRFFAGFPLYEEGEVVAVLGSFFLNKEDFTPSIQELFFTLTNETGSALDSLKKEFLRHKSENKNILLKNIFQILAEINESITRIPDPENLYDLVCRSLSARGVLKVAMIGIFSQNGTLTVRKTSETSPKSLDEIFNLKDPGYLKEGQAIRDVFLTGKSQFLSYFSGESEGLPPKGEPGSAGIKAIGFYPIFRKETTPYGVFVSFSGDENFFDPDLQELFQRIAKTVTFGLENWDRELLRKNQEELNFHMSFYDALTDLPNRRLFYDRMEQICRESMRRDSIFGVGMLDLNGFKKINDTLGHLEGDHLLAEVARRMKEKIRSVDVLARLGGDEFGFVFSGLSSDCEVVMQRILDSFDEPFILGNKEVHVSGSLGVVLFHKTKLDPDEILSLADSTMYEVKKQGGGAFKIVSL